MRDIKVLRTGDRIVNKIRNQSYEPHPVAMMASGICPLPDDQTMIRKASCVAGIDRLSNTIRKARSPEINPAHLMAGQFL